MLISLLAFPAVLRAAETYSDSAAPQQQQQKTRILSETVLDAVTNEPVINVPSGAVFTIPGGWNPSYRILAVSATGERTEVQP
mgnify:CR=1 FL=1